MEEIKIVYRELVNQWPDQEDKNIYLLSDGGLFILTTAKKAKDYPGQWEEVSNSTLDQYMDYDTELRKRINHWKIQENEENQ